MSTTRLTDLAKIILENATLVEGHLNQGNAPLPSFDENGPVELALTPELDGAKYKAIEAAMELQDLLVGPANLLRPILNATSLQAIHAYDIPAKVPSGGQASFREIAEKTGLKEYDVARMLRFAIANHRVFQEKEPGIVAHTAASRLLAEDPYAMAGLGFMFEECYQSMAHTVESLKKFGDPKPHQSGWALAMRSDVPMWDYYTAHPEMGKRTAMAMASFTKGSGHDMAALNKDYDWSPLNASKALLVDLGGADGKVAVEVARANPDMRFIVQDTPVTVERCKGSIPSDVSDRVTLAAHDFLTPQPVSADAYLFRQIFHNWSDTQSIQILRALIPALKPGAKVIINDSIAPPPGTLPLMQERHMRSMDMVMLSLFNSREREKKDWENLFAEADSRFQNVRAWQSPGSQLGLIEAVWSG